MELAKVTEGFVYHQSGDYSKARKSGQEMGQMLTETSVQFDIVRSLESARLPFALDIEDAPVHLLRDLVKNNHDNEALAEEVQQIFEKNRHERTNRHADARLTQEGGRDDEPWRGAMGARNARPRRSIGYAAPEPPMSG